MSLLDSCSLKISLPVLFALLVIAQVDLACAAGWPQSLLALFHLTAMQDDYCRGACTGLGTVLDVLAVFQFARIFAKRARTPRQD
jgi:hypothetical protein